MEEYGKVRIMKLDGYSGAIDVVDRDSKMLGKISSQHATNCES